MKRHNLLTAAAAVTVTIILAGCRPSSNPAPPNAHNKPTAAPTSAAPADPSPRYLFPANLCAVVTFDAFKDIAPSIGRTEELLRQEGPTFSSSTCAATLSGLPGALVVFTEIEVFKDELKARAQFQGIKGVTLADYTDGHDVTGIGACAYTYTHPALGPTLVVHHGTLNIQVSVTKLGRNDPVPADAGKRLSKMVEQILAAMPKA